MSGVHLQKTRMTLPAFMRITFCRVLPVLRRGRATDKSAAGALLYCVTNICYIAPAAAHQEIDVGHGIVDVFAYQEALLIEAVLGIALLTMIWVGFGRWLRYKERTSQLSAEQTAEHDARFGAHMERVEARLKAIEEKVIDGGTAARIDALPTDPLLAHTSKREPNS